MYQSHFKFTTPPFRKITRRSGDFLVPYHQDVFNLLKEKSQQAGITGLFYHDNELLGQFSDALKASSNAVISVNAFPKLSASSLLFKLNPSAQEKHKRQAVDAIIRQWREAKSSRKVLVITHAQAMKASGYDVLGMLLTRAQELEVRLSIVLMGSGDVEMALKNSALQEFVLACHTLRGLVCREYLSYVQAQCEEHGAETSPLTPARVKKIHTLTKGNVCKLNQLAHLAMLAAWTERAPAVGPRHLRLATGEVLPAPKRGKTLASVGLFASVLFAACGWMMTSSITAKLPVALPVPAAWKQQVKTPEAPALPVIENEVVNQPDAMHQLYAMWGYDASAEDALCQNAAKVNLMCKQGTATLAALEAVGYPWVSELKTGDHINYAVVARAGKTSLDLLMNNRTWQVSRAWYNQHATGEYTLLHRLTPSGKDEITAASDGNDLQWLDRQLSLALGESETHDRRWTAELMKRTRDFQAKMHLHVDGIPGEDTLMQLMRETHIAPSVLIQASQATPTTQEKHA
ncbi:peptidoglycan-binding protein [Enterobacter hormaechei]|nr:peptidoglycan-binding protein [Enterobacter hormaechei]